MTVLRLASISLSKSWLFAGKPEYPTLLAAVSNHYVSDNAMGAGNQQETDTLISGSSETIRQPLIAVSEDIVRAAWRHAEVGRNDQPLDVAGRQYHN